jgi:hypothetical protein
VAPEMAAATASPQPPRTFAGPGMFMLTSLAPGMCPCGVGSRADPRDPWRAPEWASPRG